MKETKSNWGGLPIPLWLTAIWGMMILWLGFSYVSTGEDGYFKGFAVPHWGGWALMVAGFGMLLLSLRGILRGEGKKSPPTDEDVAAGLKALERMYVKEHGTLPDYTAKQEDGAATGGSVSDSASGASVSDSASGAASDLALSPDAKAPKERERG